MGNATPQYHFLYFAPGIGARWFFEGAQRYWRTFKPIVTYDLRLVEYTPSDESVVITTIARTDTADFIRQEIQSRFPSVRHDALVYDYVNYVLLTLEARTDQNQPFGRPLGQP